MTPEIEALYQRIGQRLLDIAGTPFAKGYIRVEMADDFGSVGLFIERGDGRRSYLVDETGNLFDDFAELRDRSIAAGMGAWTQATFRLNGDGRFEVTFGYDDVSDLGAAGERRNAWVQRVLGPDAVVLWST